LASPRFCSFIHADWGHLSSQHVFHYSLFGSTVERYFNYEFSGKGHTLFIVMYFLAVAVADGYNLFQQKDNPEYRSLGPAVELRAVIFANILFGPFSKIALILFSQLEFPIYIWAALFAVLRV